MLKNEISQIQNFVIFIKMYAKIRMLHENDRTINEMF